MHHKILPILFVLCLEIRGQIYNYGWQNREEARRVQNLQNARDVYFMDQLSQREQAWPGLQQQNQQYGMFGAAGQGIVSVKCCHVLNIHKNTETF